MVLKSPYPALPPLPPVNAHLFHCRRPDQKEWPDFPLHVDAETGEKILRSEFLSRVEVLGTGLATPVAKGGLGLGEGEIIGIMGETSTEYITLIHSSLWITTPFAPISSHSTSFELEHALKVSKTTSLFVDVKFLDKVAPVAKKCGIKEDRIFLLRTPGEKSPKTVRGKTTFWSLCQEVKRKNIPLIPVRPAAKDTLAYLMFSSGTTGLPKAVMISHGNMITAGLQLFIIIQAAMAQLPPPPPGIPSTLAFLPLHHTYGLHIYVFRGMLAPSTFVIVPTWDIKLVLESIPKYKISSLPLIPSVVHQIVTYPGVEKVDFRSVVSMSSGGAYLPPRLHNQIKKLIPGEVRFVEGYGMSEATMAAVVQPLDGLLGLKHIVGCSGILQPGMEARIILDDGSEAKTNETGELWLKGDNVALGYWNNDKATKETFVDGWLRTGDKFSVDERGYFWFADRVKDILKVSGAQVSPVEIENCLLAHPDKLITDASVAGVSGGRTSDEKIPRAWVVLSPSGKRIRKGEVAKALDTWHRENLSKYKHLRGGIEIVDSLPKNPTGKTLRRVLQEKYEARVNAQVKANL